MSGLTEFCVAFTRKANARKGRKCTSKILPAVGLVPVRNAQREYESTLQADLERGCPFVRPTPTPVKYKENLEGHVSVLEDSIHQKTS